MYACFKEESNEAGSICILNLYCNITHNCLVKRGLAHKNCREYLAGLAFLKISLLIEQVTISYKRSNGAFSHPQQVIKFLLFNPKDK